MDRSIVTVSSDGKVALPEPVRDQKHWSEGTRLVVEPTPSGVHLRTEDEDIFPPTRPEDVFGSLKYDGPPVSIEDMHNAIATEAQRRRDRGRY